MTDYVDVPDAPGVPPVSRNPATVDDPPPPLDSSDGPMSQGAPQGAQWGIFDSDGNAVLVGDSTFGVEFTKTRRISDYPVEKGGFASYNKVAIPYDFRITFTKGGTQSERQDFLDAVDGVVDSLKLYDAVTPEKIYPDANAVHYDYRRTATHGVTMLTVDVFMEEVRQKATATFTNTKKPEGAGKVDDGTVQADTPTDAQQSSLSGISSAPAGH